jgi:hypothetical protein
MSVSRLVAIAFILTAAAVGWAVLGASVDYRTTSQDTQLKQRVGSLWGREQVQRAPSFTTLAAKSKAAPPPVTEASDVRADLKLDQRRKGLLWYSTYGVAFKGTYRVGSVAPTSSVELRFPLPVPDADYDAFVVRVDGREVPATFVGGVARAAFDMRAGKQRVVDVEYRTQGMDRWSYVPASGGDGRIRDLTLAMTTDFAAVDFPDGAVSPTAKSRTGDGWTLTWHYDKLVSGRAIALEMPQPLNPGPIAARISLFAPVSLLFFFASLVLLTATRGVKLHPMNYAFLAAGFFAFHLLFAYLVDRVDLNVAFAASALTSLVLCVGYLWLAIGRTAALAEAAIGQLIFLVLFSYSFFFEGITGLTITIGAIITLGYFMLRTARTDWETAFARSGGAGALPAVPPATPAPAPASTA